MQIVIPSSNRPLKQTTFDNLPPQIQQRTSLVVPMEQYASYEQYPCVLTPPHIKGIGATRQWICDEFGGHILMLDDDLVFATRRVDESSKFLDSTPAEIVDLVDNIERTLKAGFYHGAVAAREGANRYADPFLYNVRCLRALFYNADILKQFKIKFTDMEVMEDFHVGLSLLRLGFPSVIHNYIVQNQNGSDLPGGCSVYRTPDVQARAARLLEEKHPEFVKVVSKTTKTAWGGQTRTDVRVYWKKAYHASARRSQAPTSTQPGTAGEQP